MEKRRMYYFDGKSILGDNHAEGSQKKFDQNFDELNATDVLRKSASDNMNMNNMNMSPNQNNSNVMSYTNLQNFMLSGEYQEPQNEFEVKMKQTSGSENNFYKTQQLEQPLLPQELLNSLKDHYHKTKGYVENKPDILMEFVLEFKNFSKRGLKVPNKIRPFLDYTNEDIYYSLAYFNNLMYQSKINSQSQSKINSNVNNKFKSKFTQDTLKRLYPKLKTDEEIQKLKSNENKPEFFDKFATRLIVEYSSYYKEYTNDENRLYDYWLGLSLEDREKLCLTWESGEKNLEENLIKYFSDEKIITRLSTIFRKVCNYECFHPRPLHDYWVKQIALEDKFIRGLFKYDADSLYKILEDYYNKRREDDKKIDEEKIKQAKIEDEKNKTKYKVSKEQYEKLKKKFNQMAKPKDKWRTGRAMINLKKQFQYDNIVKKMIKYEFETNRVFRFPEEYALYNTENMRKTLFKNSLEKKIRKENEDKVRDMIQRTKTDDESRKRGEDYQMAQMLKEDAALEKFLRKNCIKYFRLTQARLTCDSNVSVNHFLSDLYQLMLKYHSKATKRRFPKMNNYGAKKKLRFSNYPPHLKFYFFNLYRRLGINEDGKFIFANNDNMPFWAPSLSNNCKIHFNNCPNYCKNNTHNEVISFQRTKNFNVLYNLEDKTLEEEERLHLWKRKDKDLFDLKSKIFLCLSEAEHCTFEPKINKKEDDKNLTHEDVINKRISNKVWVTKMGGNFSTRFPLVYKEGVVKRVQKVFAEGRFSEVLNELEDAFELDAIRAHFDAKFKVKYDRKLQEENKKKSEKENNGEKNDIHALLNAPHGDGKKVPERDNFDNPKNAQICFEVFQMLKVIDDYKKSKQREVRKIKEELKIMEQTKKDIREGKSLEHTVVNKTDGNMKQSVVMTIHKTNYIKDRYFKFFKTIMCPLKNECPFDIRPRWPHSDLKANTPFGNNCLYAHHISEIKFEQEVREKIKLKKNLLKELEKEDEPALLNEWIPTGPIISCNGCGKTFTDKTNSKSRGKKVGQAGGPKGLCGFCRYHQKNEIVLKKEKSQADLTNKEILKKINYGMTKAEDWDQDYVAKFGMLKKAIVLYSFRRYTDSFAIVEKLKQTVVSEQTSNDERFVSLDKKWRAKLQITDEIPKDILNYNISQQVLDYFNIKIQMSTLLVYIEKMRKGNCFSIYNRHTYLNNQIIEFYNNVRKTLDHYKTDLKILRTQLNEVHIWSERKEKLQTENSKLYDKFYKKYRAGMCPNIVNGKKCTESYRNCKFAHNPNQLNLTLVDKEKKLIKNTMNETQKKMTRSSTLVPWKYTREGFYEQGLKFDKTMVIKQSVKNKLRSKSANRNKSIDIHKLRINYHEI